MRGLVSKIFLILLLLSIASESVVHIMLSHDAVYVYMGMEDSENKSDENKTEKEDGKDKLSFQSATTLLYQFYAFIYGRNNPVITAACLSLPEIPPDQA